MNREFCTIGKVSRKSRKRTISVEALSKEIRVYLSIFLKYIITFFWMSSPYMGLTPVKILCLTVITKHHSMGEKDFNNKRKFWEVTGFFFFFPKRARHYFVYKAGTLAFITRVKLVLRKDYFNYTRQGKS